MVTKAEDPIVEAEPSALDTAIDVMHELAETQRRYVRLLLSGTKDEQRTRLAAFSAAVYRNQGLCHRDGVLFATPRIRTAFMSVLRACMKQWDAEQLVKAAHAQEVQTESDAKCAW